MRDIFVLAAIGFMLVLGVQHRFLAFLLWCWTSMFAINDRIYGFMSGVPFNMIFAGLALLLMLGGDSQRAQFKWNGTMSLYLLMIAQASLSALFAYDGNPLNEVLYVQFLKVMLFCMVMPVFLTSRRRIHAFLLVVVLGLVFHAIVEGAKFFASGGGHKVQGLLKFGDNNQFAIIMLMTVPLLVYVYRYSASRWARIACVASLVLTLAMVIGTQSRGGFMTAVVLGLWMTFSSRKKAAGFAFLAAGLAFIVVLAPSSWDDRMGTLKTVEQDHSFMNRVTVWKASSAIALQHPLTGGGFHAIQAMPVWLQYRESPGMLGFIETPPPETFARAAHSIYFEVLGDLGFVGLLLFVGILVRVFWIRRQLRRAARSQGNSALWAVDLIDTLTASVVAFIFGGAALSIAYQESLYTYVMLAEVVRVVYLRSSADNTKAQVAATPAHA